MKSAPAEEYLSVQELSRRIPYKPKTIRNLMCRGVFLEGVHFTRLTGRDFSSLITATAVLRSPNGAWIPSLPSLATGSQLRYWSN